MKKYFNLPSVYTILVMLHVIMGYYDVSLMLLRIVYVPRYLLEIWFVSQGLKYIFSSKYMKALSVLVVLFLIYGVFLLLIGKDLSWKLPGDWGPIFIDAYVLSFVPIFIFFYFGVTNQIDEDWFSRICFLYIVCAFVEYNSAKTALMLNNVSNSSEEFVNNMGYSLVSLIPVLVFLRKPIIQYAAILLVFVFVLLSYKRGAIITCSVAILFFFVLRLKGQRKKNTAFILMLSIVAIIFGVEYLQKIFLEDDVFQARYLRTIEGRYSARERLYPMMLHYFFYDNNIFTFIFGNGAYATCKYFASMAHNDWLEIAIDFGLVGVILYIVYWVSLYKTIRQSKSIGSKEVTDAIILFAIIYFITTMFSMSLSSITIYSGSVIGFCTGYLVKKNLAHQTFRINT